MLSADCSGGSDLTMSPEERVPMRRSSTREQDHRSGGTCFLLAASDYTCPADGGLRKTGNCMWKSSAFLIWLNWTLDKCYGLIDYVSHFIESFKNHAMFSCLRESFWNPCLLLCINTDSLVIIISVSKVSSERDVLWPEQFISDMFCHQNIDARPHHLNKRS